MDQNAFRRLLQTRPVASPSSSGFTKSKANSKTLEASQPAFKPRKVKKNATEGQYRDRAAERRDGLGGDYAQVEAVLEDFEKRSAGQDKSTLEAQRHYLGGDAAHSVLVKGLDMALLEQNRARAAMGTDALADDESLEKAFAESQAQPKKRTREELIRALKAKRTGQGSEMTITEEGEQEGGGNKEKSKEEEVRVLEEAKRAGKFRPIGFTPIGGGEKKKKKAKEGEGEGEKRKKKRRTDDAGAVEGTSKTPAAQAPETASTLVAESSKAVAPPPPPPAPDTEIETLSEDFDIFADAGDYEGIQFDSNSEDEHKPQRPKTRDLEPERDLASALNRNRKWIDTGSPEPEPAPSKPKLLKSVLASSSTTAAAPPPPTESEEGQDDEGHPMRLVPLTSSALPSIKDFLAAEDAASGSEKWRKRKGGTGGRQGDVNEGGKKKNPDAKVERDYKRLKSYTDKKAAA